MSSRDYEEFLESCGKNDVRYLIVGAHAVAHHARPRSTKDLDLWIEPSNENAERLLATLRDFFGSDLGLGIEDLTKPGLIVQLGVAPSRIDLLNRISGIEDFQQAWNRKVEGRYGPVTAFFLSLDDLIEAKKAAGRSRDLEDLANLEKVKSSRRSDARGK